MFGRSIALSVRAAWLAGLLAVLPCTAPAQVPAAGAPIPIRTEATITTTGGFGRLVFNFSRTNDADVRLSSGVLVVTFKFPVEVDVDRLAIGNTYISAARRDPDGKGVRFALQQNVRISSMVAGERFFIDLLPESWTAAPPPLPKEVVEDLARRAREAEKLAQQNQSAAKQKVAAVTRVRVSRQPTFTRYIFELPEFISVNADRGKEKLTLVFDALLRFDLGDVQASLPSVVQSIESKASESSTSVVISLIGKTDIRSFREDNNYVVDVVTASEQQGRADNPLGIPDEKSMAAGQAAKSDAAMSFNIESVIEKKDVPRPSPTPGAAPAEAPRPNAEAIPSNAAAQPRTAGVAAAAAAAILPAKAAAPVAQSKEPRDPKAPVQLTLQQRGDSIVLTAPFALPTPAAIFMRADTLWMVFDSTVVIDASALTAHEAIRDASVKRQDDAQIVRLKLERPRLISVAVEDTSWIIHLADAMVVPPTPLVVIRNAGNAPRASVHIPFDDPRNLYRIEDPDVGDTIAVVTALGPPRAIPKMQDFVDFRALATAQGIVIQPLADDLRTEMASDRVMIGRPSGLTLTSAAVGGQRVASLRQVMFDGQQWGFDRQANFLGRSTSLITAASQANDVKRPSARLDLARFYFARDMYPEAKGVLDIALADDKPDVDDTVGLVMRGVAKILMGRPEEGLKDINHPLVGNQNDAQLWRALASAKQGKWAEAREGFRKTEAIGMLPLELQRELMKETVQASIEVGDFATAATQLAEFETLGVLPEDQSDHMVLSGRIQEGLGRSGDALVAYRGAADGPDRAAAAEGRLREVSLRYRLGDLKRPDVITELETLTTTWRGDETEIEALQLLAKLYIDEGRYRDAFNVMRTAVKVHPNSEPTIASRNSS